MYNELYVAKPPSNIQHVHKKPYPMNLPFFIQKEFGG
jgi:hypothetical protein